MLICAGVIPVHLLQRYNFFLIYARLCHKKCKIPHYTSHLSSFTFHLPLYTIHFTPYTLHHIFMPFYLKIKIFIHFSRNYLRIWEFLLTFAANLRRCRILRWLDVGSLHIDWRLLTLCIWRAKSLEHFSVKSSWRQSNNRCLRVWHNCTLIGT